MEASLKDRATSDFHVPDDRRTMEKWSDRVGIMNTDLNCWFNAAIQSVFNLAEFRRLLFDYQPLPEDHTREEIYPLYNLTWTDRIQAVVQYDPLKMPLGGQVIPNAANNLVLQAQYDPGNTPPIEWWDIDSGTGKSVMEGRIKATTFTHIKIGISNIREFYKGVM